MWLLMLSNSPYILVWNKSLRCDLQIIRQMFPNLTTRRLGQYKSDSFWQKWRTLNRDKRSIPLPLLRACRQGDIALLRPRWDFQRLKKKKKFDANISTQPTLERRPQFNPGATLYLGVILMRHASKLPFLVWCPLSKFGWNLIQWSTALVYL